jgi:hypothetical protein
MLRFLDFIVLQELHISHTIRRFLAYKGLGDWEGRTGRTGEDWRTGDWRLGDREDWEDWGGLHTGAGMTGGRTRDWRLGYREDWEDWKP